MSDDSLVHRIDDDDIAAAAVLCRVTSRSSQPNRFVQAQRIQRAATNRAIHHGGAVVDVLNACILEA